MKKHSFIIAAAAIAATIALGTACAKKPAVETMETVTTEAPTEETTKPQPTATQPEETSAEAPQYKEMYHMLQGTVTKVTGDGEVFTLRADDGRDYDIRPADIRDVEVEIAEDVQVAIAYIGAPLGDLKDVTLVVALPEQEEWSILTEKGTTTANAMSSFTMETDDGQELSFLKDNCPIEDGALAGDSGDKLSVTYVNSQGVNYPVEIKSAK